MSLDPFTVSHKYRKHSSVMIDSLANDLGSIPWPSLSIFVNSILAELNSLRREL